MQNKKKFEPCEVSLMVFDMQTDLITTSNAHDAPEVWFGDGNGENTLGGNE